MKVLASILTFLFAATLFYTSASGVLDRRADGLHAVWTNTPHAIRISWSTDAVLWQPWCDIRFYGPVGPPKEFDLRLAESDKMQFWKLEEIQ